MLYTPEPKKSTIKTTSIPFLLAPSSKYKTSFPVLPEKIKVHIEILFLAFLISSFKSRIKSLFLKILCLSIFLGNN